VLLILLVIFLVNLESKPTLSFIIMAFLSVFYFVAYFYSKILALKQGSTLNTNPFQQKNKNIFQFLHHSYPSVILPLGLNIIVIIAQPWFLIMFVFQILIRKLFSISIITESYMFEFIKKMLGKSKAQ